MGSTESSVTSALASKHTGHILVKEEKVEPDDYFIDEEARQDEDTYRPRPQLSKPGTFLRTLAYLMKGLEDKEIDVDPEYQREVVWTADRMTGLVDSLMENYYIPPIILNKKLRPAVDGVAPKQTLVCVDGKQRLSSVLAFIKGMIPCHDHRGEKWWFCNTENTRRKKVLPEGAQKEFLNKEFVSFEYINLSPEQEEDLFARVQMGVQLSLAEKMRASTGPWQELARCYVDDFPLIYSLLKDRARAKDFQITLACFSQIVEVQHPTASNGIPGLKTSYTSLPRLLENKSAVDDGIKSHLASVWNVFQELIELDPNTFTNERKTLKGVQTFAPIEMVAVTILISIYSDTRNNRLLIRDIQALREALRENFVDLRMNVGVWRFVWDFVDCLEQIRGAIDGSTIVRSIKTRPLPSERLPLTQAAPTPVAKRGRPSTKTRPLTILPGKSTLVDVKTEDQTAIAPSDHHRTKRSRIDSGPSTTPPRLASSFSPASVSVHPPIRPSNTGNVVIIEPLASTSSATQKETAYGNPLLAAPDRARPGQSQAVSAPPVEDPPRHPMPKIGHSFSNPFVVSKSTSMRAPPTSPDEARQARISLLNSYRAPIAPMEAPAPLTTSILTDEPSAIPLKSPAIPLKSLNGKPSLPPAKKPSVSTLPAAPPHFSASVVLTPSLQTPPAAKPHTERKTPVRQISQYAGAIDLTGDEEEERQNLLSSFIATGSAEHASRRAYGPVNANTIPQHPQKQPAAATILQSLHTNCKELRRPSVVYDLTTDEPAEYNNPYHMMKQRK